MWSDNQILYSGRSTVLYPVDCEQIACFFPLPQLRLPGLRLLACLLACVRAYAHHRCSYMCLQGLKGSKGLREGFVRAVRSSGDTDLPSSTVIWRERKPAPVLSVALVCVMQINGRNLLVWTWGLEESGNGE